MTSVCSINRQVCLLTTQELTRTEITSAGRVLEFVIVYG